MLRNVAVLASCLAALTLGACSGEDSDDPGEAAPTSGAATPQMSPDELTTGLAALYAGDHPESVDSTNGACVADAVLERLSYDDLADAGVVVDRAVVDTLPALDEATATSWAQAQLSCIDFVEESTRALVAQTKGKLAAETYASCLRDALPDPLVEAAIADTLAGDFGSDDVSSLSQAQVDCSAEALPSD